MSLAIEVVNLEINLPKSDEKLLEEVNIAIDEGSITALVGLSGCGKSVFSKTIAGIIPNMIEMQVTGDVKLFGRHIREMTALEKIQSIGYIFQNPDSQIFSSVVEMELAFGPENLGVSVSEIDERVTKALKQVNMEAYRFRDTNHLSGGQKQLVAIASILTLQPKILICDEILCQLDTESCQRVICLLEQLRREGMTIFMIEHDLNKLHFVDQIYTIQDKRVKLFEGEIR